MLLISYGTRPEYIKVKPLIDELRKRGSIEFKILFTGQHQDIAPEAGDYKLSIDEGGHRLDSIITSMLNKNHIWEGVTHVLVQGDTTSAFAVALAAMNRRVKIIHLEAGLRTFDYANPFPEEYNRQLISRISSINLCPTKLNKDNLDNENCVGETHLVGNTVLDNLVDQDSSYGDEVLVTMHRRENLELMPMWFTTLNAIATDNPNLKFICPLHPNPEIQKHKGLLSNVEIIEPLPYEEMIEKIATCRFIITDSGGIQEEASFFNKKCIICRKQTERTETLGVTSYLCHYPEALFRLVEDVKDDYISDEVCPYGDGHASEKIVDILEKAIK
jgi:UDP-N-acetylglucosamine 2-epimerase (non-hydrolysing)